MTNTLDMHSKGRQRPCRGENHGRAKLSRAEVDAIRAEYVRGRNGLHPGNALVLAQRYGIGRSQLSAIIHRKVWQ